MTQRGGAPSGETPSRGEIWLVQRRGEPEGGRRPVVVVSAEVRNRHARADTVLVVPLSTSFERTGDAPTHVYLAAGETGLAGDTIVRAEDVTVVRKRNLVEPRNRLRRLSEPRICEIADKVRIAMGCG